MKPADKREHDVAAAINASGPDGLKASRPKVSTGYPDVLVEYKNYRGINGGVWVEVKMNHTDNLMNARYEYTGGKWHASPSYKTAATDMLDPLFNASKEGKAWIDGLKLYLVKNGWSGDVRNLQLHTAKGPRAGNRDSVSVEMMKGYLRTLPNKNIMKIGPVDIGKVVTAHYLKGKDAPAYYLQSADDFYMFGRSNPLGLPTNIPVFETKAGTNQIVLRVGDRSSNFELQVEVKAKTLGRSQYGVLGGGRINPFDSIK